MSGLDSSGLVTKTLEEIKLEIEVELRASISTGINTASDSPLGQLIGTFSSQLRQVWELAEAIYAAQYPDSAEGFSLSSLARLTGTARRGATASTVLTSVNVDPGTYAIGTLVAHVAGVPASRFSNADAVVNGGGSAATVTGVRFDAEDTGPIRANAGTLTVIAEPVTGWNTITNPLDATLGAVEESDAALRLRRAQELSASGATTVDAIRVDVSEIAGVTSVRVYENNTDFTDALGLLPHSIEVVAVGGDDDELAAVVFTGKAAGVGTNGSTTVVVQDAQGVAHNILFSRPTTRDVIMTINVVALATTYGGPTAVEEAIADWADASLRVGEPVYWSKILDVVFSVPGVLSADVIQAWDPDLQQRQDLVPAARELADIDTSRITVADTLV